MQAFEVYARDFQTPPATVPVSVSEEAFGFSPGDNVYYRVVTQADGEIQEGDIKSVQLPDNNNPVLHEVSEYSRAHAQNKTLIRVRGNAMGHKTILKWRLDDKDWRETSMGWENTPVHRYITLRDLSPGVHRLRVNLASDAGNSQTEELDLVI